MAAIQLSAVSGASIEELLDAIERQRKDIEFIMANLDDDNITQVNFSKVTSVEIDQAQIKNLMVDTANIKDLAVSSAKLANASVTTLKVEDAAITNAKIDRVSADRLVVATADIQDAAITTVKIGDAQIVSAKIANAQITNAHIDRLSADKLVVVSADIADAQITNAHIQDATIDGQAKIKLASITTGLIENAAITEALIADLSVTDAKIVDLAANKLTAGTIDTGLVTISGADGKLILKNNRIQVFDNQAIPVERVSMGDVNGDGSVYGFLMRGADGTTVLMDIDGVKEAGITDGAITNPKIGSGAVKNENIFAGTITGDRLVAESITAREIKTGTITAASGIIASIDASKITVGKINATQISVTSLAALSANLGNITAGNINGVTIDGTTITGSKFSTQRPNSTYESWLELTNGKMTGYVTGTAVGDNDPYAGEFSFTPRWDSGVSKSGLNWKLYTSWGNIDIESNNGGDVNLKATGGSVNVTGALGVSGDVTASSVYTSSWFRSTGTSGWYSQTYGGGWYMTDTTWIRAYNGKAIHTTNVVSADAGINITGTYLRSQSDNSLRVSNSYGYIDIAPKNTSTAHIYTDRATFYFNKDILVNGVQVQTRVPSTLLWDGASYMNGTANIPVSKNIQDCENGWILVWADYNAGVGVNNYEFVYHYLPKAHNNAYYSKGGTGVLFQIPTDTGSSFANKYIYIGNTNLVGHDSNDDTAQDTDVVLRAVLEW